MIHNRYRRQFLLTEHTTFKYEWRKTVINNYNLYYHPELEFTRSKAGEKDLILLGAIYDWKSPEQTNRQLLDMLVCADSIEELLTDLSKYSGQYVILYNNPKNFIILNDACAQQEVYYDMQFTTFGSQPKLMCEVITPEPHKITEAADFYSSAEFLSRKHFVGDTTHHGNIRHLLPNHYLDVQRQMTVRYFPSVPVERKSAAEVAPAVCRMLKGYISAVAARSRIAMAVTGGYDSRVLFLASIDKDCRYFIAQHKNMNTTHYDITVPLKLTAMYSKEFEVIPDTGTYADVSDSVDFQKNISAMEKYYDNHVYLLGNLSEIGRNVYGYHKNISADEFAFFSGYSRSKYVAGIYGRWLENEALFKKNGYNVSDMFYWEERMGNIGAKVKTFMNALGRNYFSPFCSRSLLMLLLSTPRKDRDYYINKLYNTILRELSPDALKLPINPCLKLNMIRLMTRMKLYRIYLKLGLKYRFLKY